MATRSIRRRSTSHPATCVLSKSTCRPARRYRRRLRRRAGGQPRAAAAIAASASAWRQLAVGLGDQLEQVAVGVLEIDAAAAPMVVDLARPFLMGTGEIGKPGLLHSSEGGVEFRVVDQEGVVLGANV